MRLFPELPQVAVFDTAFHQTMPAHAYRYALPKFLYTQHNVRRYGFHGTSMPMFLSVVLNLQAVINTVAG